MPLVPRRAGLVRAAVAAALAMTAAAPALPAAAAPAVPAVSAAAAVSALDRGAQVPGTAWAVDPADGRVVVSVDTSVRGARLARVRAVVRSLGAAARLESLPGRLRPARAGGQAVFGGGYRCSLGVNVRTAAGYAFLTAGHCTDLATTWYADAARTRVLGARAGSRFPGDDFGLVRYRAGSPRPPGTVALAGGAVLDVTAAGAPRVGQQVRRSGSTTGVRSGRVTQVGATVVYPEGTVRGLARTTACSNLGDSGGPVLAGRTVVGLVSGGTGDCATGGVTYVQPVQEALRAYGATVY